jgi:hypothetical protein
MYYNKAVRFSPHRQGRLPQSRLPAYGNMAFHILRASWSCWPRVWRCLWFIGACCYDERLHVAQHSGRAKPTGALLVRRAGEDRGKDMRAMGVMHDKRLTSWLLRIMWWSKGVLSWGLIVRLGCGENLGRSLPLAAGAEGLEFGTVAGTNLATRGRRHHYLFSCSRGRMSSSQLTYTQVSRKRYC